MTAIKRVKQGYKLFITTIGLKRLSISLLDRPYFRRKKEATPEQSGSFYV